MAEITTKYSIGDKLWVIVDDKIRKLPIIQMRVIIAKNKKSIGYCFIKPMIFANYKGEHEVFKTKRELLDWVS